MFQLYISCERIHDFKILELTLVNFDILKLIMQFNAKRKLLSL